jgi:hypothetical protein
MAQTQMTETERAAYLKLLQAERGPRAEMLRAREAGASTKELAAGWVLDVQLS